MKAYVIIEYGGGIEDPWEEILGVCTSQEMASLAVKRVEQEHSFNAISRDRFEEIHDITLQKEWNEGRFVDDPTPDAINRLFPEYSIEDLTKASEIYDENGWNGVIVRERDLLETESDIISLLNGNNSRRTTKGKRNYNKK